MRLVILGVFLFGVSFGAVAQDDENPNVECAAAVLRALTSTNRVCSTMEDGQVCYGHASAVAEGEAITLSQPGDFVNWDGLETLETLPINIDADQMGVVVMKLGEMRLVISGDVTLRRIENEHMPAFTLRTGGDPGCYAASNSLLIQSPSGDSVWINGVEITLVGTAALWSTPHDALDIRLLAGEAVLNARGQTQTLQAGEEIEFSLGDPQGLMVAEMPNTVQPFDPALTAVVPLQLLETRLNIEGQRPWTNAETIVQAGLPYTVIVTGVVSGECGGGGCEPFFLPESFADKCLVRCQLIDAPYIHLIGRIGGGAAFPIGYGGTFTPEVGGTLELGVNDSYFDDNAGAFYAVITAPPVTPSTCFIQSDYLVATRQGAGIEYPVHRDLTPNLLIQADAQGRDTQNRVWWRLTDGGWLLADVVKTVGECIELPMANEVSDT